jgi:predicted ribonuclease YlaK
MARRKAAVCAIEDAEGRSVRLRIDTLNEIHPLTQNQKIFFDAYDRGDYFMMLTGSAGTGKSFIAVTKALKEVLDKSTPFHKVVIVRSAVQSRDVGFTPGSVEEKMSLYEHPYMQICNTLFKRHDAYEILKDQRKIEFISTSFIRGMTFDDSIIIVDEMQNCNYTELHTVITRVGSCSKIIFCGDFRQTDLNKKSDFSGMKRFVDIAKTMSCLTAIEFTAEDIVRSNLVKEWIMAEMAYDDMHS